MVILKLSYSKANLNLRQIQKSNDFITQGYGASPSSFTKYHLEKTGFLYDGAKLALQINQKYIYQKFL